MRNLDLYQTRLQDSRKLSQKRHRQNKVETFQRALDRSYNSALVEMNEKRFQALITSIPTSPIITKKNFSAHLKHNCGVGDTIYWEENDSYWIITEHDSTEMAIFQGSIQKCLYEIFWRDPITNEEYSAHVAAKGPEETTITNGVKHSIFFDRLTDSLYLIVPKKIPGAHLLKRYFQLMVGGRKWEIEIADDLTREELIFIDLKEITKNRDTDGEKFVDEKKDLDLYLRTTLDEVEEVALDSTIKLESFLLKEGMIIAHEGFEYRVKNAEIEEDEIHFNQKGEVEITILNDDFNLRQRKVINVSDEDKVNPIILGPEIVKTLTKETFRLNSSSLDGEWIFNKDYFEIERENESNITLKIKNRTGKQTISYVSDTEILEKEVKIIPLFGGA